MRTFVFMVMACEPGGDQVNILWVIESLGIMATCPPHDEDTVLMAVKL